MLLFEPLSYTMLCHRFSSEDGRTMLNLEIRVGIDESNSVDSASKVGVYLSDGTLAATSQVLRVPTSLQDHAWLPFPLLGYDRESRQILATV